MGNWDYDDPRFDAEFDSKRVFEEERKRKVEWWLTVALSALLFAAILLVLAFPP